VLKIEKIIKEIEAITANLRRDETADSITTAKEAAMKNAAEGLRIATLSRIESIKATLEAKTVDTLPSSSTSANSIVCSMRSKPMSTAWYPRSELWS
jgi:hypothetical protein